MPDNGQLTTDNGQLTDRKGRYDHVGLETVANQASRDRFGPGARHARLDGCDRSDLCHLQWYRQEQRANYAISVLQPQADELFDFALGQLIGDTSDSRSVIRGHSLARDMYGNDAFGNGYLTINPQTGQAFQFDPTHAPAPVNGNNPPLYDITTDIVSGDPNLYGINFTRWIMRVSYNGNVPTYGNKPVDSSLEIVQVNPAGR